MNSRMHAAHHDLEVGQEAMRLVRDIYLATRRLPVDERLGLSAQMRRAAVIIPANIAKGAARGSKREFHSPFAHYTRIVD